ncbi:serpin family protein [Bradymonas sediminis]|uniref:Serpin family protein n=1 Tax=Bradymonas sediminis TaxID=1548548 RepID=A0A2Z4FND7_9DELT|nr:serpin family protein [Bradymonas sediminis]AWV90224.1 serpin family protein [Bradymonas sediminis]TDP75808.1 serpin B [Bradymonas sediminis]
MLKYSLQSRFGAPLLSLLLAGSFGAALVGCEDAAQEDTKPEQTEPGEVRSDEQRVANPDVSESARQALVAGNTDFALDLYREIAAQDANLFYSPFSISEALAMTYAGARGETAAQMAATLHLNADQAMVHPAFNWLDAHLMNLGETPTNEGSHPFELAVANSIWGQAGYQFEADFLDTLALNYGAGLNTMDFIEAPEASRQTINQWVEDKTKERIKDLIPEGAITQDTRMVLTNAIYFKASWLYAFEESMTAAGDFNKLDGSTLSVDLMQQTNYLSYAQMDGFEALELPYDGGDVSMLILLPEDLAAFEQGLDSATLSATIEALENTYTKITLPKFEYTLDLPLAQTLQDMGMTDAFSSSADLSGITGTRDLVISDVVHKAFVAVDEEGTEAAAATAVIGGATSVPPEPVDFRVDKPFIFMIRANQTGSLLFVGRVLEPNAAE